MKPLLRVVLIVAIAFTLSGCRILRDLGPTSAPQTNGPAETSAPSTPNPSLASGSAMCVQGTYQLRPVTSLAVTPSRLGQARTTIESRLDATGMVPFAVRGVSPDEITVTFVDTGDAVEVRHLASTTGDLLFISVPAAFSGQVNEGQPLPAGMDPTAIFGPDEIAGASVGQTQVGLSAIDIRLNSEGAELFDQYAASHFGQQFAIVLDGTVESAPTINATEFNGEAQISGTFTDEQVNELVAVLNSGPLPLPVAEVSFGPADCSSIGS